MDSNAVSSTKNKVRRRSVWMWLAIALLLINVAAIGLVATGYVQVSRGGSEDATAGVCGQQMVSIYNDAFYYTKRDDSGEETLDEPAIKQLRADINATDGASEDPTCQAMLFWIAIHYNDQEAGQKALDRVNALHDSGQYSNNDLRIYEPRFLYGLSLEALAGSDQEAGDETSD